MTLTLDEQIALQSAHISRSWVDADMWRIYVRTPSVSIHLGAGSLDLAREIASQYADPGRITVDESLPWSAQ